MDSKEEIKNTVKAMNAQIELAKESATYEKMRYIDRQFLSYNSPEIQEHVARAKRFVKMTDLRGIWNTNGIPNSTQEDKIKPVVLYLNHLPVAESRWMNYVSICYGSQDSLAAGDLVSFQFVAAFFENLAFMFQNERQNPTPDTRLQPPVFWYLELRYFWPSYVCLEHCRRMAQLDIGESAKIATPYNFDLIMEFHDQLSNLFDPITEILSN